MRLLGFSLLFAGSLAAQQPAESNVVFATHSGLALLMDVYKPATSNGYGIVVIPGSGWHRGLGYNAPLLKESKEFVTHIQKLNAEGYTTFVVTHRAAPRFRYPTAVEDVQRAVRYVRQHSARHGIREDRIGALGGSSGGHLVCLLGTLDGKGNPADSDPVEQQSSKVQCVVALYPATDLAKVDTPFGSVTVTSFMGQRPARNDAAKEEPEGKLYREASPVTHVSPDDPPFLLIHGDADKIVPYQQSELMEAALKQASVPVKLIRVPGGGHGPSFPGATQTIDWAGEAVRWFDANLRRKPDPNKQ